MRPRLVLAAALAAAVYPGLVCAQPPTAALRQTDADSSAPAHVSIVDGPGATLDRDGRTETSPLNMPLLAGDRLRTAEGRLEVLFGDGSALHMDARSTADILSDDLLRLVDGRVRLTLLGPSDTVIYRVDSPAGSVRITQPGEYRLALLHGASETQLEFSVIRGGGEIFTDQGATPVRAGERANASAGSLPSYAYAYNSAAWDAFDRWSESLRETTAGPSTQYLPPDMLTYAPTFDQDGDWRYAAPYGYVWYPRVAMDWRPYYNGRWDSYPGYGWTWIGRDRFAWPTHHYGRWGFSAGVWFWIPTARWAPAYVSWAYAPGYVAWSPLGFDNRAVIGVDVALGGRFNSPWHAWTVVSAPGFGHGFVQERAVAIERLDIAHRPRFETRALAPAARDAAVMRIAAPIRGPNVRGAAPARAGIRGPAAAGSPTNAGPRNASPAPAQRPVRQGAASAAPPVRTPSASAPQPAPREGASTPHDPPAPKGTPPQRGAGPQRGATHDTAHDRKAPPPPPRRGGGGHGH